MNCRRSVAHGLLLCLALFLTGCPPLPERYSVQYLKSHEFSPAVIAAVRDGTKIDHETFIVLAAVHDVSVRHMLGRNPYLTREERAVLFQDKNEFVRSGVAMNPSLTPKEIKVAMQDPSRVVIDNMAMNPSLPEEVLLYLHNQRHVLLESLAENPNCPASIVREIEESGSSLAKELLEITRRYNGGRPMR